MTKDSRQITIFSRTKAEEFVKLLDTIQGDIEDWTDCASEDDDLNPKDYEILYRWVKDTKYLMKFFAEQHLIEEELNQDTK